MSFIIETDLYTQIKARELEVLLDEELDAKAELAASIDSAQQELASYLRHRYDVALILVDVFAWESGVEYGVGVKAYLYAKDYNAETVYAVGDLVNLPASGDRVYRSLTASNQGNDPITSPTNWVYIGQNACWYVSLVNANDDYPNTGSWDKTTDERNALVKRCHIDLVLYDLHSRIKARQIPEHRVQRRDDAIQLLRDSSDPRKNVFFDLPLVDHGENSGNDMTFGHSDGSKFGY